MEIYPKFHNEVGVSIVRIGCREFKCIGDKPPQDHPHIYLNMGDASEIGCPYCSTPSNRIRPCGELMPPGLFGSTTIDCSACMEKANTRGTAGATGVDVASKPVSKMAPDITDVRALGGNLRLIRSSRRRCSPASTQRSNPSLSSSPWMRGAPQSEFSVLICGIS